MGRSSLSTVALCLLLAAASGAGEVAELPSGELEALRAALEPELAGTSYLRVEVARELRARRDSRRHRAQALDRLASALPAADRHLAESFRRRNRTPFELWRDARLRLGERNERNAFLLADPPQIHVQYARAGWSAAGDRVLVYLELRPYEGAPHLLGVFRVVERHGDEWMPTDARVAFAWRGFRPE